ncbi:MAG: LPS export ABC transporter permease LptF [Gammaproteobacteria bacterium]|nr:LPS export ABC transporter permease LptF [Gammaproteobacteria bacterium]
MAARYVNKELLQVFAMVMLILLVVAVGGRFIGFLQDAALGKYSADVLLSIMALRLPGYLQLLLPFSYYIALLLTLGRLFADQEMVVLQGGGMSPGRLLKWLATPTLVIAGLVAWLALEVTPNSHANLAAFVLEQRLNQNFASVAPGTFHSDSQGNRVTYSEEVSEDRRELKRVFIAEKIKGGGDVTLWAEKGSQYVDSDTGSRFLVLENGKRYQGQAGELDYRIVEFRKLIQRLSFEEVAASRAKIESKTTRTLLAAPDAAAQAELHWRLALPLFAIVASLIAVGFARVKPRQGRFARLVPGLGIFMAYYLILIACQNAMREGELPTVLGFWFVHLLFLALALVLLRRMARPVKV